MTLCLFKKKSEAELEIAVFETVNDIHEKHWKTVVREKNIYLTLAYLEAVEKSLFPEIIFRYLLFYNEKSMPVAVAIVQVLPFFDKELNEHTQLCHIRDKIKSSLIASSGVQMMTCGSPFACGENGFMFTTDITEELAFKNLARGLIKLQKYEKKSLRASVLLVKEFWPRSESVLSTMKPAGFRDFMIDVNMVMKIHPRWKHFDDYLFSMVTKFRTKAKSAFKKSASIQILDFTADDILKNKAAIERLYRAVVEKSDFKFGILNGDTFVYLKRNLKTAFIFKGYFLKNELIGFSSAFLFNHVLDANYVGIDYRINRQYAIYQRMLYDYVQLAIDSGCKELWFGRTAEEIKSTVGAEPVTMKLYVRHQNTLKNRLLKSLLGSLAPSTFTQRNPFKVIYAKE